ncbi:MAG: aspartate--tRNA ligase [Candidatus Parvarchaeota archaeon]|nr:aspartate--tRNA ligase [Candidatus Parvarchaeum tengchongense]MCW1295774.1 aspartate--tRNA ligase [Candidatus Parvarchaeum tengchongense]MCW1298856.1 aspartate--tRNA ligase [Candidatus Parvarchaeum tengchongense]MCW1312402.1 aspartate--tRNA ligase [Candidatus Parvarchaeum tengchongense]
MDIYCGDLSADLVGKEVTLSGWCRYIRDHGGKLFVDLADRTGISQVVFDGNLLEPAKVLGREYVIRVKGLAQERDKETIDKENPTGKFEVKAENLIIINKADTPPFEITDEKGKFLAAEDLRLKYRYLDLRRTEMISNIVFRDKVTKAARQFFWDNGFLELETPTLVKDTYETGARPFIVPSRTKKGSFYSLPQSPQIYKQLIMVAGFDKYFQVARAFRDEDQREDRQPEFTQLDLEVSFKDENYIMLLIESLIEKILKSVMNEDINLPLKRLKYEEAINRYGSDKPDLRYGYEIIDITDAMKKSDYNTVKRVLENGGKVKAICFSADYGKSERITKDFMLSAIELAKTNGLKGLTWLFVENGKLKSIPEAIASSLSNIEGDLMSLLKAKDGDIIIFAADLDELLLLQTLGKIRKAIGDKIGKFSSKFSFLWVIDFPLFEVDGITKKLKPSHNPFTAPFTEDMELLEKEPEKVRGRQFDLVLNGNEVGGGAVRINNADLQLKILKMIGMSEQEALDAFGFLITALRFGAPEDIGFAIGLDRFVTVLKEKQSIRDFILFPKTKSFDSPIDGSPTKIEDKRLLDDYKLKRTD